MKVTLRPPLNLAPKWLVLFQQLVSQTSPTHTMMMLWLVVKSTNQMALASKSVVVTKKTDLLHLISCQINSTATSRVLGAAWVYQDAPPTIFSSQPIKCPQDLTVSLLQRPLVSPHLLIHYVSCKWVIIEWFILMSNATLLEDKCM